ncbi:MAG: radical SAM protein [Candidatus Cloacimonetes bacterium]|nr:radical SAM protein [Candidatus Cloacimonadota bacterium]MCF7814058.1 radical SAM protein [Candidatus Cloacimonadota bacterium]MCF7868640.1 radical SAM protein [Candidatus Cloacimonadota bacterium]MCF7884095.1 radical SAM protein [Candidatus Cloacimonadota bacterium]
MNLYRGCQHQCIYCDTRSECYQIEDFENEILYKENAVELLRIELASKRVVGTIGLGSMNDPYQPIETELKLTHKALEVIAEFGFPLHIITKSVLVLNDLEILKKINRVYATVSFTITTTDDDLSKIIEPRASLSSERYDAMKILSENGIQTGISMMPILPFIEDNVKNISDIVEKANLAGVKYIIPAFGMTMRDRQRQYFYKKLDEYFPGIKQKYIHKFGGNYSCGVENYQELKKVFQEKCHEYGISTRIIPFKKKAEQLRIF